MRTDVADRRAWRGGRSEVVSKVVRRAPGVAIVALAIALALGLVLSGQPASAAPRNPGEPPAPPPITTQLTETTTGRPAVYLGDAPDPGILRVGNTYYSYTTNTPGIRIPVLVSVDLTHWNVIAEALPAVGPWATDSRGNIWAPTVIAIDGGYRLYYSAPHAVTHRKCIGSGFALSPKGPFIDASDEPLVCEATDGDAIDPSVFEISGLRFLYWKGDRDPGSYVSRIWAQQLGPHGTSLIGDRNVVVFNTSTWEQGTVEGPSMVLEGGRYLLFYSGGSWGNSSYGIGYAECAGVLGPCTKVTTAAPWMQSTNFGWASGGQEFVRDTFNQLWMVHHAWTGAIGYGAGGRRSLFIERVSVENGVPVRQTELQPGGPMDPFGRIDGSHSNAPYQAALYGWTIDPDGAPPIQVDIHVDGRFKGRVTANDVRADVGQAYPPYGAAHGFHLEMTGLPGGTHEACAWAINAGLGGTFSRVACTTIEVRSLSPIAAVTHDDGRIEVVAEGGGQLQTMRQVSPNGAWGPWVPTGLSGISDPVVGQSADGRLEVFGVDWRGGLLHAWQLSVGGPWSGWHWVGVDAKGKVALGTAPDGRLELFATEPGGGLIHRWQLTPSGAWSDWVWMGIFAGGSPVVGPSADGRLELFVPDQQGGLVHTWQLQVNGVWGPFQWTGVFAKGTPALGIAPDGRLELFVSDLAGGLIHQWQLAPNAVWSAWSWTGVFVDGPPVVGRHADGRLEILVPDARHGLIRTKQLTPNGVWAAWNWMGVFVTRAPVLGTNSNGSMVLLADNGSSTPLWTKEAPGSAGWIGFGPLVPGAI